jgi:hypothetical protein
LEAVAGAGGLGLRLLRALRGMLRRAAGGPERRSGPLARAARFSARALGVDINSDSVGPETREAEKA